MNNQANESILNELPDGLRQAVAASMAQVPNREAESRVISKAIGIVQSDVVAIGVDGNKNSISTRTPIPMRSALSLAGMATLVAFLLFYVQTDGRIHLNGRLVNQLAESDKTEWIIKADVNDSQLAELSAHATSNEPYFVRCFLQTNPSVEHRGRLAKQEVDAAASSMLDGASTIAIRLNQDDLVTPSPCQVVVTIKCGRESIGRAWFGSLTDFIESRWMI